MPLSVTKYLNSVLRQVCVKCNVSFIFEEDSVDHKVNQPMRSLYSTDLVHLDMKGMSLWLRKVRAFLGLVTPLKRLGRQSAKKHSHYDNPTAFRAGKNMLNPGAFRKGGQHRAAYPLLLGFVLGNIFYQEIKADQHTLLIVESKKLLPLKG